MSIYHDYFTYLGQNSRDKNLVVASFDSDNGFVDSFLSKDIIGGEKFDGSHRYVYGSKYNKVLEPEITVIKNDYGDFTESEIRDCFRWLTNSSVATELKLFKDEKCEYVLYGTVSDVQQYKMDSRCIGMKILFTCTSPWAFSENKILEINLENNKQILKIQNDSDDLEHYTYLNVFINNNNAKNIKIKNITMKEETAITNIAINENIEIRKEHIIETDVPYKIFGESFNFVWPKLTNGENLMEISANGVSNIRIEYQSPIKIGNFPLT